MDKGTAIYRVFEDTHRQTDEDKDRVTIALIKAMEFYKTHRLHFNEADSRISISADTWKYDRATFLPDLIRPDTIFIAWKNAGPDWRELTPVDHREYRRLNRLELTGCPTHWAWYGDNLLLGKIPDQQYTIELWYVQNLKIPIYTNDGSGWTFLRSETEDAWDDGDSWCVWLNEAPELMLARARWDLYFHYYDDLENAQKAKADEQAEYQNLRKTHGNLQAESPRRGIDI